MTQAPERIWAFYAPEIETDEPGCNIVAGEHVMHGGQQYLRDDIAPNPETFQQMREALEKIACRHVTEAPLWWQELARAALKAAEGE